LLAKIIESVSSEKYSTYLQNMLWKAGVAPDYVQRIEF
jgi:hypothetical protein